MCTSAAVLMFGFVMPIYIIIYTAFPEIKTPSHGINSVNHFAIFNLYIRDLFSH